MSILIPYLIKLSISLAVVWLFYQFILRRLTFYNSNRWFLLGYTLLSFYIPFINISPILEKSEMSPNGFIQLIPSVNHYTAALEEASQCPVPIWSTNYDKWDLMVFAFITVAGVFLLRFIVRYLSFLRIRRKSKLISNDGIKIYQVDDHIMPFSFGNAVFINTHLHSEEELSEIVQHEFIHIRQKHTIDILWAEFLCIMNWYNPFAWLLKRSIRQNLEFIADNKVIANGINKKEYQYLLLKVIGNNQYSIATQFNFSSLKKRIVMMNKTKSAKRQLGRFLFLVPVIAIILLSFRKSLTTVQNGNQVSLAAATDTLPGTKILNSKGYYVDIVDDNGNCTIVVKDKNKKEVKRVLLTEWDAYPHKYETLYGELTTTTVEVEKAMKSKNSDIKSVTVKGNIATVTLKNGKIETYTLALSADRKAFEERCGLIEVPIATTVAVEPTLSIPVQETLTEVNVVTESIADEFEINDNKAVMKLRNGKTEEYNLADPKQKAAFEKKFGKIITPSVKTTTGVYTLSEAQVAEPSISTTVTIAPAKVAGDVAVIGEHGQIFTTDPEAITIEPDILFTITKKTTQEELDSYKANLKSKGFELIFSEIKYENGALVRISGSIKTKDNEANFVGVDFNKIIVSQVKKGEKVYFRIDEVAKKKGVS